MPENDVMLAIQLPIEAEVDLHEAIKEAGSECSVMAKFLSEDATKDKALNFDPATGMALAWVALKVAGLTAETVAAKIIAELVYKKLQARAAKAMKTLRVRFPDGETFNLEVDDPASMERLREIIAGHSKR
jgi:hypothetical protein